ncbi:hypothetical protein RUW02_21170, partial [Bacillus sp. IG6]|uniref:hypothetical protein n=1 Tax=Bacillus sp. IG6 TaxID=3075934 RepID=UPI0028F89BB2
MDEKKTFLRLKAAGNCRRLQLVDKVTNKSGLIDKLFLLKCVWNLIFGGFTMLTKHSKDQREQLEVFALS